jgi:polysaccharide export outer membrane protein
MRNTVFSKPATCVFYGIGLVCLLVMGSSCGNIRSLTYMQGKFDTTRLSEIKPSDPVIQKGDLLSIIVYSDNPQATSIYNQTLIASAGSNSNSGAASSGTTSAMGMPLPTTPGYMVDEKGNIDFQGLGTLHIQGLTRSQLTDTLKSKLRDYLKNP